MAEHEAWPSLSTGTEGRRSFATGTVGVNQVSRPGTIERSLATFTIFVLFFGLPTTWFSSRAEVLAGESATWLTTLVTLGLVLLGVMRILGSIDLMIRVIRLEPWLFFLVLYLAGTTFWSIDPYLTFLWSTLLVATTAYAVYLFLRFDLREVLEMIAMAGFAGGVISLALVLFAPVYGLSAAAGGAWTGVFSQKNALGFAAALIIPSMLILDRSSPRLRWLGRVNLVLYAALLVGSESKTMLLATIISVCLLFFYQAFRARRTLRGAVMVALAGSMMFTVAFVTANLALIAQWLDKDITFTGRTILWESLVQPVRESFFFGYGYSVAFTDPLGPLFEVLAVNTWGVSHAHNAAFQLMLDGGIIAFGAYLWIYLRGVSNAIEVTRRVRGPLGVWPLSYLSTVLLVSISEPGVTQGGPGWLLMVLALLYARAYRDRPIVTGRAESSDFGRRRPRPAGGRLKVPV